MVVSRQTSVGTRTPSVQHGLRLRPPDVTVGRDTSASLNDVVSITSLTPSLVAVVEVEVTAATAAESPPPRRLYD